MRQKRVKSYRKVMQLYCSSFKFREPYQMLVDAEFCKAAVQQNMEFQARIEDVLQGVVKPMITQCSMQVLYDLGEPGQKAVDLAKTLERRMCNHLKARPEEECLTIMGGTDNKNRYVIATQSLALRKVLRTVPGLPIVYIARSVVLLEAPSDKTILKKKEMENQKLHAPLQELAQLSKSASTPSNSTPLIDSLHSESQPQASTSTSPPPPSLFSDANAIKVEVKPKKKKGPKGPNPLSIKKKKPEPVAGGKKRERVEGEEKVERKRPRVDEKGSQVSTVARAVVKEGEGKSKRKRKRGKKEDGDGETTGSGEKSAATVVSTVIDV